MLWGPQQESDFNSSIQATIDSHNVQAILSTNEPNEQDQSNLSPEDAANMWKHYLEPLRSSKNVRLGSPAPSSNPNGLMWMQDFFNACNGGCSVDFIALRESIPSVSLRKSTSTNANLPDYYDVNATDFQRYVQQYHDTFNKPIWVTEWACQNFNGGPQCSYQEIQDFMNQTQTFMDATDYVERYAWFGAFKDLQGVNEDDALMDTQGRITALGEQYVGGRNSTGGSGGIVNGGGIRVLDVSTFACVVAVFIVTLAFL